MAGHGGVDGERRHRPVARGQRGRQQYNRMLGWNGRSDVGGRKTDAGGITGPPCSGAGRRILPPAAGLLSLRVATSTQGCARSATVVGVRDGGGSGAPLFALPVRGDPSLSPRSCPTSARPSTSVSWRRWGLCCRTPGPGRCWRNSCRSATFQRWRRPAGGPCEWALGWNSRRHRANPLRRRERSHSSSTAATCARFAVIRFARSR